MPLLLYLLWHFAYEAEILVMFCFGLPLLAVRLVLATCRRLCLFTWALSLLFAAWAARSADMTRAPLPWHSGSSAVGDRRLKKIHINILCIFKKYIKV